MFLVHALAAFLGAAGAAAQFTNPTASSRLDIGQAIQIRWNTNGLQAPLSISLIPGGTAIRQDIVLQQIAINISNVGVLAWSADQTITAFPVFAMVIVDARGRVVVSDPFAIQSLTRQPALITDGGRVRPTVTGPIKVHVSGTNTLDKMIDAPINTDTDRKNGGNKNNGGNRKNEMKEKGGKSRNGDGMDQGKKNNKGNNDGKDQEKAQDNKDNKENNGNRNGNNNDGQKKLLPLPGLPKDGEEAPVSLQPLPNVSAAPTQEERQTTSTASSVVKTSESTSSTAEAATTASPEKDDATKVAEASKPTSAEPAQAAAPIGVVHPSSESETASINDDTSVSVEEVTPVGGVILPPTPVAKAAPATSSAAEEEAEQPMATSQPQSLLPLPKPNVFNAELPAASPTSATPPGGSFREEPAAVLELESPASLMPLPGVATEMSSLMSLPAARSSTSSASSTESSLPVSGSSDQATAAASGRLLPSLVLGLGGFLIGAMLA